MRAHCSCGSMYLNDQIYVILWTFLIHGIDTTCQMYLWLRFWDVLVMSV